MNKRIFVLLALVLFSLGCTVRNPGPPGSCGSPDCCPDGTLWMGAPQNCCEAGGVCTATSIAKTRMLWEDWIPVCFLVLVTGFLVMGVTYMVAYAMGMNNIMIFVKNELVQLAASAFILGNVLFFITFIDTVSEEYGVQILAMHSNVTDLSADIIRNADGSWTVTNTQNSINVSEYDAVTGRWNIVQKNPGDTIDCPSPCHFYLARGYLGMTYERIYAMAREVVKMYASLVWIDRVRVGVFFNLLGVVAQIGITLMPFTGLSIIYHSLGTCFDFMAKAMVSVKFQETMLMYLQNGVFPIFLIAGLIARSIWFLRKLGGLMIAIAVGVYTLFPLLYVLCWYTVDTSTTALDVTTDMIPEGNFNVPLLPWQDSNLDTDGLQELLFTRYDASNNVEQMGLLDAAALLMVPALAIPLLNILITIAFIKTLSATLGGDMELAGLTRLI